jgi:hypothetical protein
MLPYQTIKHFLKYYPQDLLDIVNELRNLVASITPDAIEDIRHGGLVYYHYSGGPVSAGICGISPKTDHIRLYFTHGAFIPDPKSLLKGSGKAKRYVNLHTFHAIPWNDIQMLIEEHSNFDPRSFQVT